jgi:hypothetical protein
VLAVLAVRLGLPTTRLATLAATAGNRLLNIGHLDKLRVEVQAARQLGLLVLFAGQKSFLKALTSAGAVVGVLLKVQPQLTSLNSSLLRQAGRVVLGRQQT